jgi:hypothetical protein
MNSVEVRLYVHVLTFISVSLETDQSNSHLISFSCSFTRWVSWRWWVTFIAIIPPPQVFSAVTATDADREGIGWNHKIELIADILEEANGGWGVMWVSEEADCYDEGYVYLNCVGTQDGNIEVCGNCFFDAGRYITSCASLEPFCAAYQRCADIECQKYCSAEYDAFFSCVLVSLYCTVDDCSSSQTLAL